MAACRMYRIHSAICLYNKCWCYCCCYFIPMHNHIWSFILIRSFVHLKRFSRTNAWSLSSGSSTRTPGILKTVWCVYTKWWYIALVRHFNRSDTSTRDGFVRLLNYDNRAKTKRNSKLNDRRRCSHSQAKLINWFMGECICLFAWINQLNERWKKWLNPQFYERKRRKTPQMFFSLEFQVFADDEMPETICDACQSVMEFCYRFKQMCKRADTLLKQYPLTGMWPEKLQHPKFPVKLFQVSFITQTHGEFVTRLTPLTYTHLLKMRIFAGK